MSTKVIVGATVLCLVFPGAMFAQGFSQGDKSLLLGGSGANDDDFADFIFSIEGKLDYFFTDNISGGIQQGVQWVDVPGSDDDWILATKLTLDYNWDVGSFWPYVGVHLGYLWGDRVQDTWVYGPEAGLRWFVNETTFIQAQVQYEIFENSGDDQVFDDDRWVYAFGIGFRWQ